MFTRKRLPLRLRSSRLRSADETCHPPPPPNSRPRHLFADSTVKTGHPPRSTLSRSLINNLHKTATPPAAPSCYPGCEAPMSATPTTSIQSAKAASPRRRRRHELTIGQSRPRSVLRGSIKRAAINRANSQHSTGPRTPAGKQRSSLNALRHGSKTELLMRTSAACFSTGHKRVCGDVLLASIRY
jgi:hypothetical protein